MGIFKRKRVTNNSQMLNEQGEFDIKKAEKITKNISRKNEEQLNRYIEEMQRNINESKKANEEFNRDIANLFKGKEFKDEIVNENKKYWELVEKMNPGEMKRRKLEECGKTVDLILEICGNKERRVQVESYLKAKEGKNVIVPQIPYTEEQLKEITRDEKITNLTRNACQLQEADEKIEKSNEETIKQTSGFISEILKMKKNETNKILLERIDLFKRVAKGFREEYEEEPENFIKIVSLQLEIEKFEHYTENIKLLDEAQDIILEKMEKEIRNKQKNDNTKKDLIHKEQDDDDR